MTIGARIKSRRTELKMTQQELANKLGKTKSSVSRIETNLETNLTADRIKQYAEALDCSVSYLMGWDDMKFNEPMHDDSSELEKELLDVIKELDDDKLSNVLQYAKFLAKE